STRYSNLAEELRSLGYIVESLKEGPITYEKLSQYNVFAITVPSIPPKSLTGKEIEAIKNL
ncbi:MAG: hypothetical protein QXU67_03005, partial [Candidatus Bathyarchaeia archaeon]